MEKVAEEYEKITEEYEKISGRKYALFEEYELKDAEKVLVLAGSVAGTAKDAIDELRKKGEKVGLIKIELFRPFPFAAITDAINRFSAAKDIIVMDRAQSIGSHPPLYSEIINSLYQIQNTKYQIRSIIYGLGGRDVFKKQIEQILEGKFNDKYLT